MSEVPRYSLPELRAISSGARDRLSHVSRILIVLVGADVPGLAAGDAVAVAGRVGIRCGCAS